MAILGLLVHCILALHYHDVPTSSFPSSLYCVSVKRFKIAPDLPISHPQTECSFQGGRTWILCGSKGMCTTQLRGLLSTWKPRTCNSSCSVLPLANSDHNGLLKGKPNLPQPQRQIWDYKHADFTKDCELINNTDWDSLLLEDDINASTLNWQRQFLETMSKCISHRTLPKRQNLLWVNQHIIRGFHKHNKTLEIS